MEGYRGREEQRPAGIEICALLRRRQIHAYTARLKSFKSSTLPFQNKNEFVKKLRWASEHKNQKHTTLGIRLSPRSAAFSPHAQSAPGHFPGYRRLSHEWRHGYY